MTGLAVIVRDHAQALEYDLMTMTGRTLCEYGAMGAGGMLALVAFVRHLPPDSATWRAANPDDEHGTWCTTLKTNAILADIFDVFATVHSKKGRTPKPYPRPRDRENEKKIGKGAIPIGEFMDWWESGE